MFFRGKTIKRFPSSESRSAFIEFGMTALLVGLAIVTGASAMAKQLDTIHIAIYGEANTESK